MNKIVRFFKNLIYSLPFGLKGADTEIMGSGESDTVGTELNQQVNDKRVAKHLLKGELTKEVEELRYRTYKVDRESKNYTYAGHGNAVKTEQKEKEKNVISFTQENQLICNDVLTELNRIDSYSVDKYLITVEYNCPVRIKADEFIKYVDVYIKDGEKAKTTLRFDDIKNPQSFYSKPFISQLERMEEAFSKNDTYALKRYDLVDAITSISFTTFKATNKTPDVVTYSFVTPTLIDIKHEDGEFKLTYEWEVYGIVDLTGKFFNAELEEKYKKKEKKKIPEELVIKDNGELGGEWWNAHFKDRTCSVCGKRTPNFNVTIDNNTGEVICIDCYKKSLLKDN